MPAPANWIPSNSMQAGDIALTMTQPMNNIYGWIKALIQEVVGTANIEYLTLNSGWTAVRPEDAPKIIYYPNGPFVTFTGLVNNAGGFEATTPGSDPIWGPCTIPAQFAPPVRLWTPCQVIPKEADGTLNTRRAVGMVIRETGTIYVDRANEGGNSYGWAITWLTTNYTVGDPLYLGA